jgi:hypothetical protein
METMEVNNKSEVMNWLELQNWLDKVCVPYTESNTYRKHNERMYQEYRDAYNTYLWEFENC